MMADTLRRGGVGVMPSDTVYIVTASALRPEAVARVYKLRKRNPSKPFIILIDSPAALRKFGVRLDRYRRAFLKEAWPGPVSVILPAPAAKFRYLHRGTRSLAFRVPAIPALQALLRRTGPLVVPSANWEGWPIARTIREAQKYFGASVDFYVDGGRISKKASTLIDLTGKAPVVLRK